MKIRMSLRKTEPVNVSSMWPSCKNHVKMVVARLDLLFLILFPILFIFFNLIYWLSFLPTLPQ